LEGVFALLRPFFNSSVVIGIVRRTCALTRGRAPLLTPRPSGAARC
jgi:hypothetical protein